MVLSWVMSQLHLFTCYFCNFWFSVFWVPKRLFFVRNLLHALSIPERLHLDPKQLIIRGFGCLRLNLGCSAKRMSINRCKENSQESHTCQTQLTQSNEKIIKQTHHDVSFRCMGATDGHGAVSLACAYCYDAVPFQ